MVVVVGVGIRLSTTGCIGDGVYGLGPIVVVGFANSIQHSKWGTHLGTHSHSLPLVRLAVHHHHAGAFVVTGACGDWAIEDGGDEESGM